MDLHIPAPLKALLPDEVIATCQVESFEKGQFLFRAGKPPQKMFYIVSGQALLTRPGIHGELTILQRISQGFISEASLLIEKYHCDAHFNKKGIAITIPVEVLRSALKNSDFSEKWTLLLSREIMRLRTQAERLTLKDIRSKVIHLIETEGKSGVLTLVSDLKSIASELGATHEALYRTLKSMEDAGVLIKSANSLELTKK